MICRLKNVAISAISTYLPPNVLEMDTLSQLFGEDKVKVIRNATGVDRVHVADAGQTASDECFEAAQLLFEKEGLDRSSVNGLIFVSQTFDYIAPATSVILQDRLGLSKDTVCFDVSFGCSGYINGVYLASTLIASGSCDKVLLLAGDTTTKMINEKDRSHRMVFGDCGSATLIEKAEGKDICVHLCSNGAEHKSVIVPAGGFRMPATEETKKEYTDSDGNIRSLENLVMDGLAVFNFIVKDGASSVRTLLEYVGWTVDDVDFFAFHQATKFTFNHLKKKLKIKTDNVPLNIANYGNTGPTSVPLVITDTRHNESGYDTSTYKKVIMSAYGIGLSWGSIACDLSETRIYRPINQSI